MHKQLLQKQRPVFLHCSQNHSNLTVDNSQWILTSTNNTELETTHIYTLILQATMRKQILHKQRPVLLHCSHNQSNLKVDNIQWILTILYTLILQAKQCEKAQILHKQRPVLLHCSQNQSNLTVDNIQWILTSTNNSEHFL